MAEQRHPVLLAKSIRFPPDIQRFAQLAELAPVELADLADKLAISPTLPERDQWIEQARQLAESSDTGMATA